MKDYIEMWNHLKIPQPLYRQITIKKCVGKLISDNPTHFFIV